MSVVVYEVNEGENLIFKKEVVRVSNGDNQMQH
jgi:hypothetical protein